MRNRIITWIRRGQASSLIQISTSSNLCRKNMHRGSKNNNNNSRILSMQAFSLIRGTTCHHRLVNFRVRCRCIIRGSSSGPILLTILWVIKCRNLFSSRSCSVNKNSTRSNSRCSSRCTRSNNSINHSNSMASLCSNSSNSSSSNIWAHHPRCRAIMRTKRNTTMFQPPQCPGLKMISGLVQTA